MTTLTAQSYLAANLASLGERNASLASVLATADPAHSLVFFDTPQGVPAAALHGKQLCSRHRPLDEAERLVADIDLVEHAVVVVLGFGLGYHVQKLVERADRATVIVVFEPDVALLRGVFDQIDHSKWMKDALLVFVTDAADRAGLGSKLQGAEAILAQGVEFLEHPGSRARLGESVPVFTRTFTEFIATARTTLMTTLMRSVETTRNLLFNLDHYAAGPGISDLQNAAAGFPAIVVSAGPSLHHNVRLLTDPAIRDRAVIIAVQTTLKPLLAMGIRPHFVTALDYHEISRRFYEDLDPAQLRGVTLVCDPKVHPVVVDSFPGTVRCCSNGFLDKLLGPLQRDMGTLPSGATVAHLAVYLARFLGCNPIAMIGQDLGFTDGMYYAPNAAIHEVWAPELNPFNTIEMMEWQRIVRHRLHLHKTVDVHGKSIYTDAQMVTYLQQFERDFAEYRAQGLKIIDASEGGVRKEHAECMSLSSVLSAYATRPLPPCFASPSEERLLPDRRRLTATRERVMGVRTEVRTIKSLSLKTAGLIRKMLDDQQDAAKMAVHFRHIEAHRRKIEKHFDAFELLNLMNQLGVFRRLKADRRLHMQRELSPVDRQRAQLQRDLDNVTWLAEASDELTDQLIAAEQLCSGRSVKHRPTTLRPALNDEKPSTAPQSPPRVSALIPVDPARNGLGIRRSLAEPFQGIPVIQATLERLGRSVALDSIILIAPRGSDVESLIDRSRIGRPVEIEWIDQSPFGPEHEAIAKARLWAPTCWRAGVAGASAYDEVLCPQVMHAIMLCRDLSAAFIAGPDWPLVTVDADNGGCDAIIARHREHPEQHRLVFTQAPPGMSGCLITVGLMSELAQRNRLSTVGALLVYQPHAPQHDPIAREANVQLDHRVRQALIRTTFDSPRQQRLLRASCEAQADFNDAPVAIVQAVSQAATPDSSRPEFPRQVTLELCTDRQSHGLFMRQSFPSAQREPMTLHLAESIISQIAESPDTVLNLSGAGDPLLHPRFDQIIRIAKGHHIAGICVRTELLCDRATVDRLLDSGVDIVQVDLNADRAATYQAMMGMDRFKDVLQTMQYLLDRRVKLTPQAGTAALALPWVIPTLQRCAATYEDIESFYDRWQHVLGTVVIQDPPRPRIDSTACASISEFGLTPASMPARAIRQELVSHLTICSDGSVPLDPADWSGGVLVCNVKNSALLNAWRSVVAARFSAEAES